MRILISYFSRNLARTFRRAAKQFLRFTHTQRSQILNKSLPHILAEQRTEMIRTDICHMRNLIQRNLLIHIMSVNKIHRLLQNVPILISGIFITNLNRSLENILCISNRFLCRLAGLCHNIIRLFLRQLCIVISHLL